jgi:hypothetical protein
MTLPPDLQDELTQFQEAGRTAERIAGDLSEAQFHWQPLDGRAWSIGQCLEHLAVADRVYAEPMARAIEDARARGWSRTGPIASTAIGRWFVASLEPPVTRRSKAPSKIRPRSTASRDEILRLYREAHDLLRGLVAEAASIDVNRAKFRNPLLPLVRVRVGTGFRVINAHERRHLWQTEQVRRAEGFPT